MSFQLKSFETEGVCVANTSLRILEGAESEKLFDILGKQIVDAERYNVSLVVYLSDQVRRAYPGD